MSYSCFWNNYLRISYCIRGWPVKTVNVGVRKVLLLLVVNCGWLVDAAAPKVVMPSMHALTKLTPQAAAARRQYFVSLLVLASRVPGALFRLTPTP